MDLSKKVYIMMSGGVDSSVAASVLKDKNYDLTGVYMKCWTLDQLKKMDLDASLYACNWEDDLQDARMVAKKLGIPFEVWDFQEEYLEKVVSYMLKEYSVGRTPNPDVMCNSQIKFGIMAENAIAKGADYIATGHYARIQGDNILRGLDSQKDQSYFISRIKAELIPKILFPIGEFENKAKVREYAQDRGLVTADKKDSQGLCFIGQTPLREMLKAKLGSKTGYIVQENADYNSNLVATEEIANHIKSLKKIKNRVLIGIDGAGGSGKSTLAKLIKKQIPGTEIVSIDDFYLPTKDITSQNYLENTDYKRLQVDVLEPFLAGEKEIKYKKYNWGDWGQADFDGYIEGGNIKNAKVLILEGISVFKFLEKDLDFKIWCHLDGQEAKERGILRDINDYKLKPTQRFTDGWDKWVKFTNKYISSYNPSQKADLIISTKSQNYKIIKTIAGNILGTHPGAYLYTIGQREKLDLSGGPWLVSRIDISQNLVYVTHKSQPKVLETREILVEDMNWIKIPQNTSFDCQAQVRYRQKAQDCSVYIEKNKLKVIFNEPVRAVAPGQIIVFYNQDTLLGGGVIKSTPPQLL